MSMEVIKNLSADVTGPLENFRQWVMTPRIQQALLGSLDSKGNPFEKDPEVPCSNDYLMKIASGHHIGYPIDMHGLDLNYQVLQKDPGRIDHALFDEIRDRNNQLDDELQTLLGAKLCALKAFYPKNGHIGWHNNWNAPGYNIILTHSTTGSGYWRHIDPAGSKSLMPDTEKLVHIQDTQGWHCKVGYFGSKAEADRVMWHCAYTPEPRITVSYVIYDFEIWKNMVSELKGEN